MAAYPRPGLRLALHQDQQRPDAAAGEVLLAHPGTQHSYETALGLEDAGLLQSFVTGFYYDPNGFLARMLSMLPARLSRPLERELLRRHRPALSAAHVRTMPALELAFVATARLPGSRRFAPHVMRLRNRRFERAVAAIIRRERPAAVVCPDSCALAPFHAAREVGARCVLDQSIADQRTGLRILREEAELCPEFADTLQLAQIEAFALNSSREPHAADRIVAGSDFVRSTLIDNGVDPSKITVVPYGADTLCFRPPPPRRHARIVRVLFVGQLGQRKGIKYLLEAVKRLDRRDLELVVVGDPVGGTSGLMRYRGLFTHVTGVAHAEVHRWYQSADMFVLPSLFEGSARVTYEALASGLPVITTANSGSVVRDGIDGFIVPIRDVDALAAKIAGLADDRTLREQMGRNARARAEQFTWARYRRSIAAVVRGELGLDRDAPACAHAASH